MSNYDSTTGGESGVGGAKKILGEAGQTLKSEVPHLKLSPSEYIRRNVWWTSQPMDEPENRRYLADIFAWLGWDRIMFSSDYPHWDFDDPSRVILFPATAAEKHAFFTGNAQGVYGAR